MENKFLTLEQTIRRLGKAKGDQPLEKDMNDQIHIGGYTSKNFEVSRKAQELFASLPKNADVDAMERSANLHDLLFGIHKKVFASDRSSAQDVESAEELEKKIMSLAKQAGLESKHDHVGKSIAFIRSKYDAKGNVFPGVSPQEVEKRFTSPPKDYQSEVSSDNDIDNVKDFIISRNKRAQRKLKIIDDEYKPGEKQMSNLDKIRAAFLEGYKNKKEAKTVEEASGTKSQVARIIDTAKTAKNTLKDQPNNPEAQRVMRQSLGKIGAQLKARQQQKLDAAKAAKRKSLGLDENELENLIYQVTKELMIEKDIESLDFLNDRQLEIFEKTVIQKVDDVINEGKFTKLATAGVVTLAAVTGKGMYDNYKDQQRFNPDHILSQVSKAPDENKSSMNIKPSNNTAKSGPAKTVQQAVDDARKPKKPRTAQQAVDDARKNVTEQSCKNCECPKCKKKQKVYEHVIELTERRAPRRGISRKQFMITVSKGQFRKRIRNDPKIIVAHQKQGWAIIGGAEKYNPKKDSN